MSNRLKYILTFTFLALVVQSCQKDGTADNGLGNVAIEVASPTFLQPESKGKDPLQLVNLVDFGISALWNYDGTTDNQWYLSNNKVAKNESSKWEITPNSYWPLSGDLSFFFYAPYSGDNPGIKFIENRNGMPQLEFTPSTTDIQGQIDFCVGQPVMNLIKDDGPVPVHFEHTLTQILFKANYTGKVPKGFFVLIDRITIKNVAGTKILRYSSSAPYFEWEDSDSHSDDGEYTLERSKYHLQSTDSLHHSTGPSPDYRQLSNSSGRLYLLPQTLGPDAVVEVEYGFYYNSLTDPKLAAKFIREVKLPEGQEWASGKTINYNMTLDIGISAKVSITSTISEWLSSGNTHSSFEFE